MVHILSTTRVSYAKALDYVMASRVTSTRSFLRLTYWIRVLPRLTRRPPLPIYRLICGSVSPKPPTWHSWVHSITTPVFCLGCVSPITHGASMRAWQVCVARGQKCCVGWIRGAQEGSRVDFRLMMTCNCISSHLNHWFSY